MLPNTHIFVDNSNIYGGAQRVAVDREKIPWQSVRIDYKKLFRLLRRGHARNNGISMLAGSVPPGEELWAAARDAGFDTTLLRRVPNDDGRLVEQSVDESIHLRISNILLDEPNPGTIVIATGDGAQTKQNCSFTDQTLRAARLGWNVEILSWRSQLSKRLRDTRVSYPQHIKILILDEWYKELVFIKEGNYLSGTNELHVPGRATAGLNLTDSRFHDALSTPTSVE